MQASSTCQQISLFQRFRSGNATRMPSALARLSQVYQPRSVALRQCSTKALYCYNNELCFYCFHMAETFNFCLVVKLDRVRQGINATAAVRAALLLGLFVAETLAARDDQVLMRLVTPRSLGSKLSQKVRKRTKVRSKGCAPLR